MRRCCCSFVGVKVPLLVLKFLVKHSKWNSFEMANPVLGGGCHMCFKECLPLSCCGSICGDCACKCESLTFFEVLDRFGTTKVKIVKQLGAAVNLLNPGSYDAKRVEVANQFKELQNKSYPAPLWLMALALSQNITISVVSGETKTITIYGNKGDPMSDIGLLTVRGKWLFRYGQNSNYNWLFFGCY